MKLLLDENLPHPFRHHLRGHEVFTVHYMGWSSIGNGKLLQLAADAGFDALITLDSGVPYQQNLASLWVSSSSLRRAMTSTTCSRWCRPFSDASNRGRPEA